MSESAISAPAADTAEPGATASPAPADAHTQPETAPAAESSEAAGAAASAAVPLPDSPGIAALALRRIRPLSPDWAAVLAAAVLAVVVSLGWKVTW